MHILNTRPTIHAQQLTQALTNAGHHVSALALMSFSPLNLSESDSLALKQIVSMNLVIVISPTAAQFGIATLRALFPEAVVFAQIVQQVQWLAVGQGTVDTLAAAGIKAHKPTLETSEGLIALREVSQLVAGQSVMLWRGDGGRELVQQTLLTQGVLLHNLCFYRRAAPTDLQQQWQTIITQQGLPDAVLISSEMSWQTWRQLVQDAAFTPTLLVLGRRLQHVINNDCQQATGRSPQRLLVLDDLKAPSVLRALNY